MNQHTARTSVDRSHPGRGYTLPEVLLTLTISSALIIAMLSMLRTIGAMRSVVDEDVRWRIAAESVLRCVHDEVACGWRPNSANPSLGPRIQTTESTLTIRVDADPRSALSSSTVAYAFDASRSRLTRAILSAGDQGDAATALGDVAVVTIDVTSDSLVLGIRSTRNGFVERRFPLPPGVAR